MNRRLALYTTFDGESIRATFDAQSNAVIADKTIHLSRWAFRLAAWHRPVVVVQKDWQQFGSESCERTVDQNLAEWSRDELGASFGGTVFASDAIAALVRTTTESLPAHCRLIYELENHIHVLTLDESKPVSLIRFAAVEAETGWSSIFARSDRWLKESQIAIPAKTYLVGTFQCSGSLPNYLFPDTVAEQLAAAGGTFVDRASIQNQPSKVASFTRSVRLAAVASAALVLIGTVAVTALLFVQKVNYSSALSHGEDRGQLTAIEQQFCDSVARETNLRLAADSLAARQVRWSKILTELALLSNSLVSIDQLGSRFTDSGVELAFTGEGKSHPAVTDFIAKLKGSDQFDAVQLVAFDRSGQKGYRFKIQCLAK